MSATAVLVVDDDRLNRLTLTRLLEAEGYQVRAVEDGQGALDALEEGPFGAVLLDLIMPGVGGLEVLRVVKASPVLWRTPVLVISAVEDTASIVACLEAGAEDFISKPFDPLVLRARINAALARRRFGDMEAEYHKLVDAQAEELAALRARLAACTCGAAPSS